MAIFEVTGEIRGFAGATKRDHNRMLKRTWIVGGEKWHADIRPQHFGPTAAMRYGYTRRSRVYTERKFREFGHRNPLELTGVARAASRIVTIRVVGRKPRGVNVLYPRLRVFNFKPPNSNVNMRAEFEKVTKKDGQTVAKTMQRVHVLQITQFRKNIRF